MKSIKVIAAGSFVLVLGACATAPVGPRVAVMPAPGKPFEVFVEEDRYCRYWANSALGQSANEATDKALLSNVAAGTILGAGVGALAGGHRGAGSGAAVGMALGTAAGAGQTSATSHDLQYRYDLAYQQCMYAKGNQIPGYRAAPANTDPAAVMPPPPPKHSAPPRP